MTTDFIWAVRNGSQCSYMNRNGHAQDLRPLTVRRHSVDSQKRNPPRVASSGGRDAPGIIRRSWRCCKESTLQPLRSSSPPDHYRSRLPRKGGRCSHQGEPSVGRLVQMDGAARGAAQAKMPIRRRRRQWTESTPPHRGGWKPPVLLNQHPSTRPLVYRKAVSRKASPRRKASLYRATSWYLIQQHGLRPGHQRSAFKEKRQSAPEYLASSPGKGGIRRYGLTALQTVGNGRRV